MKIQEKNPVLKLLRFLWENTDENHPVSMKTLREMLEEEGYPCCDDSIRSYLRQLQNEIGLDIVSTRGRYAGYYVATRLMEKAELKLVVDAINASNFVEKNIAKRMRVKIKALLSRYEATELDRDTLAISVAKAENHTILYNVDAIQQAFSSNSQISFYYMKWDKDKKLVRRKNKRYCVSPWALIWAYDRYYLYAYAKNEQNGQLEERIYRVDKIFDAGLLQEKREGTEAFSFFNASTYVSRRLSMFPGEEKVVSVKISENLVGAFIDQFGKDIMVENRGEEHLIVTFTAAITPIFLGWLIGLGGVEIIGPESVRESMQALLQNNLVYYQKC